MQPRAVSARIEEGLASGCFCVPHTKHLQPELIPVLKQRETRSEAVSYGEHKNIHSTKHPEP
jgi:hypothetical protein